MRWRPARFDVAQVAGLELAERPTPRCARFRRQRSRSRKPTCPRPCGRQAARLLATRAEVCKAGDSSGLMHIGGGLSRLNAGTRTVHLARSSPPPRDDMSHVPRPFLKTPRGGATWRREPFPVAARRAPPNTQLRRNLGKATATIRAKRGSRGGRACRTEAIASRAGIKPTTDGSKRGKGIGQENGRERLETKGSPVQARRKRGTGRQSEDKKH